MAIRFVFYVFYQSVTNLVVQRMRNAVISSGVSKDLRAQTVAPEVDDDTKFDARVVTSLIDLYHALNAGREIGDTEVAELFGWLPPVLTARAERCGVLASNVAWGKRRFTSIEQSEHFWTALQAITWGFLAGGSLDQTLGTSTVNHVTGTSTSRTYTAEQWVNEVLAKLPIYSRFELADGAVVVRSVPMLTSLPRCLAYAYARVLDPSSPLHGRITTCADTRHGLHWFLAVDSRKDKKYCSAEHQNAHAQYQFRQRRAAKAAK